MPLLSKVDGEWTFQISNINFLNKSFILGGMVEFANSGGRTYYSGNTRLVLDGEHSLVPELDAHLSKDQDISSVYRESVGRYTQGLIDHHGKAVVHMAIKISGVQLNQMQAESAPLCFHHVARLQSAFEQIGDVEETLRGLFGRMKSNLEGSDFKACREEFTDRELASLINKVRQIEKSPFVRNGMTTNEIEKLIRVGQNLFEEQNHSAVWADVLGPTDEDMELIRRLQKMNLGLEPQTHP